LRSAERLAVGRNGLLPGGCMRIVAVDQHGIDIEKDRSFGHRLHNGMACLKLRFANRKIGRPAVPQH